MSLTAVLRSREGRRVVGSLVRKPRGLSFKCVIPPSQMHPGTVGTAYDLLVIEALRRRGDVTGEIGAPEHGLSAFERIARPPIGTLMVIDAVRRRHAWARKTLSDWHGRAPLSPDVVDAALVLARLSSVYRAPLWWLTNYQRGVELLLQSASTHTVDEVSQLVALTPWSAFTGRVLANPEFGLGTIRLYGADADLICDDTVVELKTTKHCSLTADHLRQVVAYAVLANRYGVDGVGPVRIRYVAIYFARSGELIRISLRSCISALDERALVRFLTGFYTRGRRAS